MAKLKGPLFSLSASGQLAKTLVFADWKGIDYARQHVVPANPNSADQQTQRGYLTAAMADFHSVTYPLNALDLANLNRYAGIQASAVSGVNMYIKEHINTAKASVTVAVLHDTTETPGATGEIDIVATSKESTNNVTMFYGTSKTALVNQKSRSGAPTPGTTHTFALTGLTPGVTYYYKIVQNDVGASHSLGLGQFVAA